jgi:hypothetical protein
MHRVKNSFALAGKLSETKAARKNIFEHFRGHV